MNGLSNDMLESYMNSLKYAEVAIKYKGQRYHIEAGTKKYTIGVFKKRKYEIDYFFDIEGDSYDDAYNKLMNEPLFGGEALKGRSSFSQVFLSLLDAQWKILDSDVLPLLFILKL